MTRQRHTHVDRTPHGEPAHAGDVLTEAVSYIQLSNDKEFLPGLVQSAPRCLLNHRYKSSRVAI